MDIDNYDQAILDNYIELKVKEEYEDGSWST